MRKKQQCKGSLSKHFFWLAPLEWNWVTWCETHWQRNCCVCMSQNENIFGIKNTLQNCTSLLLPSVGGISTYLISAQTACSAVTEGRVLFKSSPLQCSSVKFESLWVLFLSLLAFALSTIGRQALGKKLNHCLQNLRTGKRTANSFLNLEHPRALNNCLSGQLSLV